MSLEARPERWNGTIVALHWAAGAVVLGLIALGWIMVHGGLDSAATFDLYQRHKSWGFVALALTACRLAARFAGSSPQAPASPRWERRLAGSTQGALYLLTLCAILSGWLVVSTSPLPVPTRFFDLFVIPNIAGPDPSLFAAAELVHQTAAWAIAALVALHVAGALKHHFVDRDDVLKRMLPRRRRA
ncbi:MAG TPA: cytochrome b [Roseiarcus sp.]|nr:cytochrome b [Roseiarcus sp.]